MTDSDPIPVDPNPTRVRLLDFIRHAQAEAQKFPDDSIDRHFLLGQALGAFLALREMSLDLAAACDDASTHLKQ